MEVCFLSSYPLVAGLLFVFATRCTEAVECYVCSWSPYDHNSDFCSTGNFDPLRVQTHDCDIGCEAVAMRDKNGELEMFYRNCITNEPVTYEAINRATKLNQEKVYTCDSRLCNTASFTAPRLLVVWLTLSTSFVLVWAARSLGS